LHNSITMNHSKNSSKAEQRPRIKLGWGVTDKFLETTGWVAILLIWIFVSINYTSMPATIPVHYNANGQADSFGKKSNILLLTAITTVFFVGLTVLNRFPHIFNYPTPINSQNARRQYTNATRMIRYLKLILVLIFGSIILLTIQYTKGKSEGLGIWFLSLMSVLIYIPLFYFIARSLRK